MFERFTERARKVVVKAQDEARSLKQNYIGTEHILLGLIDEKEGIAARVFGELNIDFEDIRSAIKDVVTEGTSEVKLFRWGIIISEQNIYCWGS